VCAHLKGGVARIAATLLINHLSVCVCVCAHLKGGVARIAATLLISHLCVCAHLKGGVARIAATLIISHLCVCTFEGRSRAYSSNATLATQGHGLPCFWAPTHSAAAGYQVRTHGCVQLVTTQNWSPSIWAPSHTQCSSWTSGACARLCAACHYI